MNPTPALAGFVLLLAALGGVSGARCDEPVQVAPHRAAAGLARSEGTPPLLGYLARPDGPGRFPAVVLLHGCSGFTPHDTEAAWTLKSWGYVGLALDSLGNANMCAAGGGAGAEARDAYAALRYLGAQSFVAADRVAVMGYSMGGAAALSAVEKSALQAFAREGTEGAGPAGFRAMIAYYPPCAFSSGVLTAPALILVGERDDWTPAADCRKLAAHESDLGTTRDAAAGTPVDLVVYPDATHAFDFRLPPRRHLLGHLLQYDEAATRDAEAQVRAFLRRTLGEHAESP